VKGVGDGAVILVVPLAPVPVVVVLVVPIMVLIIIVAIVGGLWIMGSMMGNCGCHLDEIAMTIIAISTITTKTTATFK
jgi:hypothetical protein